MRILLAVFAAGILEHMPSSAASQRDLAAALLDRRVAERGQLLEEVAEAAKRGGIPLVRSIAGTRDSVAVTFIYMGDSSRIHRVGLVGGPGSLDSTQNELRRVGGTTIWVAEFHVPNTARFLYAFQLQDASGSRHIERDSLNAKSAALTPGVVRSVFEAAAAPSLTRSNARTNIPKGTVSESIFTSHVLGQTRRIWIYRPPGFETLERLPLVVIFDGAAYLSADYVPTPDILDNLIGERRIRPVVAVFIDTPQPSRRTDLWLSDPFADFITDELIPWARASFGLSTDPRETAVAGSSLGGLTAMFAATRRPQVVGHVISQSGSYWTGRQAGPDTLAEWLTRTVASSPAAAFDVWMEVGIYEGAASSPIGMVPTNRRMRDALTAKGYSVHYQEFAGGHEYLNWRASLPNALEHVFGRPCISAVSGRSGSRADLCAS